MTRDLTPKNAGNVTGLDVETFLLIGGPGSGKTTQYRTLPGKTFVYFFDPNAAASVRGASNIDYAEFLPDRLDINVKPLAARKTADKHFKAFEPVTYIEWEQHLEAALDQGFFDNYDFIGIDSMTTFGDCVMDRVLWLNGRLGKHPEQADWTSQMTTFQNVFRTLASLGKTIVCTAHNEVREDALTKRIFYQPVLTGRLRTRIPLLFSNIFRTEADRDAEGNAEFVFHTVADKMHQYVRTSFRGLSPAEDATIRDFTRPQDFGLGALLKEAGLVPNH